MNNKGANTIPPSSTDYNYLSLRITKCLRGIFAIFVLLHHINQRTLIFNDSYIGTVLESLGYLSVGMFFFYTGYGMTKSREKNDYVRQIGKRRILPLYCFYTVLVIFYALWRIILFLPISVTELVQSFFFGYTLVVHGWYLQACFVLYLIIWMTFTISNNDKSICQIVFVSLFVFCFVCNLVKLSITWYVSIFCSLIGMVWAIRKDKIDIFVFSHKALSISVFGSLFVILYVLSFKSPVFNTYVKMMTSVSFSILVTVSSIVLPHKMINNSITLWLGEHSLEIYVCQGFFLLLHENGCRFRIANPLLFSFVTIFGTLLLSIPMKRIYNITAISVKSWLS